MLKMFRSRSWFGGSLWKPKNFHSLEHLKYLYNVLSKNQTVTEQNKNLLVESLRCIAEILIWGDQNDSSVFDFFLEKNMLSFFLKIMKQKCGSYVCVQLLQTLNIIFENVRNETSLYYLLSNNHVNSIIVHKFDFSNEEVMAYYISFLKTLSLKLNKHTIHFFYNEHTHDFPLYTEAIKFFKHSESMVRIAVRTLTLNVYRVDDNSMQAFIRDRTAAPYFSNLVWFIGSHVLELDACVRNDADHQSRGRLSDLVAEHLDHLHYINDILMLNICMLNRVLVSHLLNRLLIPLYVYSLTKRRRQSQYEDDCPHTSSVVSLFLLSQVFLIIKHQPLVRTLARIILHGDMSIFAQPKDDKNVSWRPGFVAPSQTLEKSLEEQVQAEMAKVSGEAPKSEKNTDEEEEGGDMWLNITDEEKEQILGSPEHFTLSSRPFLESIFHALECGENDYAALFALCLLYVMGINEGMDQLLLDSVLIPTNRSESKGWYNNQLVERLIRIISQSCETVSKVRLATLELTVLLMKLLVYGNDISYLRDHHLAAIEGAREEAGLVLRNFYKSEDMFLDMFEDDYLEMKRKPVNVEYLMMDSSILLPPTGTPLTGIEFSKRLPCGEVERARRAIRVFFLLRELSLCLRVEPETQLPLTNPQHCVQLNDVLDLNNSDLIAATVCTKEGKTRRFLVIDIIQLILVEPDTKRLGWGVAKFVGFLQDLDISGDKDDSRVLHITVHRPSSGSQNRVPLLAAKFTFDDHIRCMAAKQRLTKGRTKARQRKFQQIAKLLEIPMPAQPSTSQMSSGKSDGFSSRKGQHLPRYGSGMTKVPGFATSLKNRECASPQPSGTPEKVSEGGRRNSKSREGSPSAQRPLSEEIPLESMKGKSKRASRRDSPKPESLLEDVQVIQELMEDEGRTRRLSRRSSSDPDMPKSLRPAEAPAISLLDSSQLDRVSQVVVGARALPSPKREPPTSPPAAPDSSRKETETSFIDNSTSYDMFDSLEGAEAAARLHESDPEIETV